MSGLSTALKQWSVFDLLAYSFIFSFQIDWLLSLLIFTFATCEGRKEVEYAGVRRRGQDKLIKLLMPVTMTKALRLKRIFEKCRIQLKMKRGKPLDIERMDGSLKSKVLQGFTFT